MYAIRLVAVRAAACCCLGLAAPPVAAADVTASRPLTVGFADGVFLAAEGATRALWLERSRAAGAGIVRIRLSWASVAPAKPPATFNPEDPAHPAYRWSAVDGAVRDAASRRLRVLLTIVAAPGWAEGGGRPGSVAAGTWRPRPVALAQFAHAAAVRYSGSFRTPATGVPLPRVRSWQVWNEPNLARYLTPQRVRGRDVSPSHYRSMLAAAYTALKRVRRDNFVVSAGTAPFGDRSGERVSPVAFYRKLLCLRGRRLGPAGCPNPARFDAYAHHPYSVGAPRRAALGAEDASVADLHKLSRLVRAAVRSGGALPRRRKRLWVTELSWDSSPPDPDGVPAQRHARWLAEAFYMLWRQGADTIIWFQVGDSARGASYGLTNQSGVYFRDGKPKAAQRAFRFPFVTRRTSAATVRAWIKPPRPGIVRVELLTPRGWATVARTRATSSARPVLIRLRLRGAGRLRARTATDTSAVWRQR